MGRIEVDPDLTVLDHGGVELWRLRAWMLVASVLAVLLIVFVVVEWAGIPLLVDPRPALDTVTATAALIGIGLLVVDAVVPVPSSVVMVGLGATFGVVGGTVLSVLGSVGGFAVGYLLGRWSRGSLAQACVNGDLERTAAWVQRWGALSVVVSRPVPLMAETVAFTTGAFAMRPLPAFAAAMVGTIGPAAAFAYAGWRGASTGDWALILMLVSVSGLLCWFAGRRFSSAEDTAK